jgi:transposase-like protein
MLEWVQRFHQKKDTGLVFLVDETVMQIDGIVAWLWIAIKPIDRSIHAVYIPGI